MKIKMLCFNFLILAVAIFFSFSCSSKQEEVNIKELLPEGAVKELTNAYPDFKVTLVSEKDANVSVKFGEKSLHVSGIEKEEVRERIAKYVVQYLQNPNKKAEDKARREAYEKLPPKEKMVKLIERIKKRNPNFEYKWVKLGEGNTKVEYGDNSLRITGIENDGAREEWAYAIYRIQKEIDKTTQGEQEK